MATKTISLREEAYDRLREAKRFPGESFSDVVLRATWPEDTMSAGDLLAAYRTGRPWLRDDELDRLETVKRLDVPPEDKWAGR